MEDYHKPDQQTLQALRNIANRLRISSIRATSSHILTPSTDRGNSGATGQTAGSRSV
uniref:Uncharacterized protein n=1 Tax=Astyanax mexicanus TaxID=7994 RepID=A0A8B9RKU7_ASTMX